MPDKPSNLAGLWHIYMVECSDSSYYTGITTDIERRIYEHNNSPQGARYTRARRPVKLCYQEQASSRSEALKRERQIKRLIRNKKKQLVACATESTHKVFAVDSTD